MRDNLTVNNNNVKIDNPRCTNCGKESPCGCAAIRIPAEWCVPIHAWNKLVDEKIALQEELKKLQASIQTCKVKGHIYYAPSYEYPCPLCALQVQGKELNWCPMGRGQG